MKTMGIYAAVLLLISIGLGIWTGVAGKPYSIALFTVHKLSGAAFAILTIIIAVKRMRSGSLTSQDVTFATVFVIALVAVIATGAIMSGEKPVTLLLRGGHIASALISAVSGGGLLAFLVR